MRLSDLIKAVATRGTERPNHKYIQRIPDGKGGWYYKYAGEDTPHSHQPALDFGEVHTPRATPPTTAQARQVGLFDHLAGEGGESAPAQGPLSVAARAARPALARMRNARPQAASSLDLFDYASRIKEPPQEPLKVDRAPPAQPAVKPAAAPATVDLTKGERKSANEEALQIVQAALAERRALTDAERAKVSLYTGEGGIGSSLNQFFTRGDIAKALWTVLAKQGIQEGAKVLEPACGAGVFLDTAPAGVHMTGVEIDPQVAAVADALHGSRSAIYATSFEEFAVAREGLPDAQFDAVITNAPFCTRTGSGIRVHKPEMASADRYFLDTALDSVKDGGLVGMIVHHSVMDGRDGADFRQRMAARAELVDAWRLPAQAFEHAHTSVVSDMIVLRKRDSRVAAALLAGGETVQRTAGVYDEAFVDGDWFDTRGERVLGKALSAEQTGWRATVEGDADKVAPSIVASEHVDPGPAGAKIDFATLQAHADAGDAVKRAVKVADVQLKSGATKTIAGITYLLTGHPPRWHRLDAVSDVAEIIRKTASPALQEAGEIAAGIGDLLQALQQGDFYKSRFLRRKWADRVNEWVANNGLPAEHAELVAMSKVDPAMLRLVGAVQDDGTLSDVLSRDPPAVVPVAGVDAADLAAVCAWIASHNNGYVALADVASAWSGAAGKGEADLRRRVLATGLYAIEVGGELRHVEDYLTGNLFNKRDYATEQLARVPDDDKPQIQQQIQWLTERIEKRWKPLDDVLITPGAGWIPNEVLSAFLSTKEGYSAAFGSWDYTPGVQVTITHEGAMYRMERRYADGRRKVDDGTHATLLKSLNRLRLQEREHDSMDRLAEVYSEWVKGSALRPELEERYNRLFFADARREFSATELNLPGMSQQIKVNPYINETVRWATDAQRGIIALDVGLGKTFTGILLARQLKSQGVVKKPVVIVPKSVATNWAEEIETITPGARVLVIGETRKVNKRGEVSVVADGNEERNRKLALMQQNDYDLVLITKPAFERVPLKADTVEQYETSDFWYQRASSIETATGDARSAEAQEKRLQKLKASYEKEQAGLDYQHAKDRVFWEDLGVDCLLADEAHAYKNLNAARARRGQAVPKFLGGSGLSKQAKHMKMMARVVREQGKGRVYFLTATPTKNSPFEVYNMLEHLVPEEWEKRGIRNAEEFIDRYCELRQQQVLNKDGEIEEAQVVSGFQNLDELTDLMDRYVRVRTAADVGLPIPSPKEELVLVDMTPAQRGVYAELRAEAAKPKKDDPGKTFRMLDKMKKAAQDLELYDPEGFKGEFRKSPKYKACVDRVVANVMRGKKTEAELQAKGQPYGGHGQLIFVDSNASHERIKTLLVEAGLDPSEVEIINADETEDSEARQDVVRRFNSGKVSVVIGNTATMGEGVNLQKRTTDIHHLDQPWDPGSMRQRNGRGVRQGNPNAVVRVHTYLAKASFDGFRHGTLEGKRGWLEKLRSGAARIENEAAAEALQAHDDLLVMLSDDPDAAKAKLDAERSEKMGAWREKKRAESVHEFGRILLMRERVKGMTERGADKVAVAKAQDAIDKAVERLKRDEMLPESIKPLLDQPNVRGLVDAATGKVFLVGYALRPDEDKSWAGRWIVEGVDAKHQTLQCRQWGSGREKTMDVSAAGSKFMATGETVDDEVKEAVEKTAASSDEWRDPFSFFQDLPPEAVERHVDEVRRAMRAKIMHTPTPVRSVLVRNGDRLELQTYNKVTPETHVFVPAGADLEVLVQQVERELKSRGVSVKHGYIDTRDLPIRSQLDAGLGYTVGSALLYKITTILRDRAMQPPSQEAA